jgi:subtilisin family serine protease
MTALARCVLGVLAVAVLLQGANTLSARPEGQAALPREYIVQAQHVEHAVAAVQLAGGRLVRRLALIDGVVARLTPSVAGRLRRQPALLVHQNGVVRASNSGQESSTSGYLLYPSAATQAHLLHERTVRTRKTECREQSNKSWRVHVALDTEERALQGWGVTVAVIDSGFMEFANANDWTYKEIHNNTLVGENLGRCIIYRDFLPRDIANDNQYTSPGRSNSVDQHGHGTHVASTIADNRRTPLAVDMDATPVGVAPQVSLLIARALDKDGAGSYGDVIAAIEWIVTHKTIYNVKVLNLSIYAPISGPYWSDPLNQAVMRAWQAGITVVAAAGNGGPEAGTLTAPGNIPYLITVGAVKSGRYTESGQDELALYSSRGPTESAFVKPDLVVPATRTIAPMPTESTLAPLVAEGRLHETAQVDYEIGEPAKQHAYFQLSGTSMAAAQVSGIAALILQANPHLSNDQVKYRLLSTAAPAWDELTNQPVYSVWEQGAGLLNAAQAIFTTTVERANLGMDIGLDLDSDTHYWGHTTWDEATGQFALVDPETNATLQIWSGSKQAWSGSKQAWSGSKQAWSGSKQAWSGSKQAWSGGLSTWANGESFWAGHNRTWAGTSGLATSASMHTELLVTELQEEGQPFTPVVEPRRLFIPLLSAGVAASSLPQRHSAAARTGPGSAPT